MVTAYVCLYCARTAARKLVRPHHLRRSYAALSTTTATQTSIDKPKDAEHTEPAARSEIPISFLNRYTQTTPPSDEQLSRAAKYFDPQGGRFLFTAAHFRDIPSDSSAPEVALIGRSNVGKSSLLNALFNLPEVKLARVSQKAGRTRAMQFFGMRHEGGGVRRHMKSGLSRDLINERLKVGKHITLENWIGHGGVVIVDMPGYGFRSQDKWGEEAIKYLRERKQLRRVVLLVDPTHGLKDNDEKMFELLRSCGTQYQVVLTKMDKLLNWKASSGLPPSNAKMAVTLPKLEEVRQNVATAASMGKSGSTASGDILSISSTTQLRGQRPGMNALRWALLQACGLDGGLSGGRSTTPLDTKATNSEHEDVVPWKPTSAPVNVGGRSPFKHTGV